MTAKIRLRRMLSDLLSISGIHWLLERLRLSERAFVLMYHRVARTGDGQLQPGMYVTAATFERQLAYLARHFRVVFLDDLLERVRCGAPIGRHCALTFDDGWQDNYSLAFPLLQRYGLPATIFLSTGYVGTGRTFWTDELVEGLTGRPAAAPEPPPRTAAFLAELAALEGLGEVARREWAIETLKRRSPGEREEVLAYLRGPESDRPGARPMMNWEEVREMSESGLVRFGAHTVSHELLDQLPLSRARDEIVRSRVEIESRLGRPVTAFAYPNGNHSAPVREILARERFQAAVTTRRGLIGPGVPLLEIPRIGLHEDVSSSVAMLRSKILLPRF